MTDRIAEIRARLGVLKGVFMTCVAGDGTPYVKLQFKTLAEAQECHSLIADIPYMINLIDAKDAEIEGLRAALEPFHQSEQNAHYLEWFERAGKIKDWDFMRAMQFATEAALIERRTLASQSPEGAS